MRWKLTTLIENHVDKEERYMCEHGLAILIESENQEEQVCLLMEYFMKMQRKWGFLLKI